MYVQTDMSVCESRSLCHDLVLQASDHFFLLTAKQRCLKERVRRMERERAKKRKINTEKSVCVCVCACGEGWETAKDWGWGLF